MSDIGTVPLTSQWNSIDWNIVLRKFRQIQTRIVKYLNQGTSYQAANWIYLGETIGKGRKGNRYFYHGRIKDVYVYPLVKDARKILCSQSSQSLHTKSGL